LLKHSGVAVLKYFQDRFTQTSVQLSHHISDSESSLSTEDPTTTDLQIRHKQTRQSIANPSNNKLGFQSKNSNRKQSKMDLSTGRMQPGNQPSGYTEGRHLSSKSTGTMLTKDAHHSKREDRRILTEAAHHYKIQDQSETLDKQNFLKLEQTIIDLKLKLHEVELIALNKTALEERILSLEEKMEVNIARKEADIIAEKQQRQVSVMRTDEAEIKVADSSLIEIVADHQELQSKVMVILYRYYTYPKQNVFI